MERSFFRRIPPSEISSETVLDHFLEFIQEKGLTLYPAQEEAILELFSGKNVVLNTPTGSGKSLVATALHFHALCRNARSIYTSPIKALVNEKFLALCKDFGPEQVGMVTGDSSVNASAPILCCTAEILAMDALRQGDRARVDDVVMDEFHYYSDRERGVAWQIPLLTLPKTRFLLMSATLGDTAPFEKALTLLNGKPTVLVRATERPVPLEFEYSELPLHETVARLIAGGRAPIYLVCFTQRECAEEAQNFMSVDLCTKEEKKKIAAELSGFKFSSPYGKEIQRFLRHGMGLHHAGLLPKYRVLVERLAQKGLLKMICGTDTLGVGVNIPLRSVLFTRLCKFDGEKTTLLSIRDFQQISGRAGRKGFDDLGSVVVQAPAHIIENLKNEQKAAGDPKRTKKLVKQKPPEKGFLPWDRETLKKLSMGLPEPLVSRFEITHGMLLNVLGRSSEEGCAAMRQLIRDCHESENSKKHLRKKAFELFRSLVERKIIELAPLRVHVDLQQDFSLNHTLSLYLLDALKLLDPSAPDYALDALTLVESILEDPDAVLRKQLDRLKDIRMREMKAEGIEFDQRIEELEKLEYPKPRRDFVYSSFNEFAALHPWVGQENIRPKSIAREIYEGFYSFSEYVREYGLQRAEGTLLRYLSDAYKGLVQNIPELAKTEELEDIALFFRGMLQGIDSSLLDEWERLRSPTALDPRAVEQASPDALADITKNPRSFTVMIRNETFRIVKALAAQEFEDLPHSDDSSHSSLSASALEQLLRERVKSGRSKILTTPSARAPIHTSVSAGAAPHLQRIQQVLLDPEENNDWVLELELDLELSRSEKRPVMKILSLGPIA